MEHISLTAEEKALVGVLRKAGVFEDIEPHRLDHRQGAIIVPCSDGDQMYDVFTHHADVCRAHRENPRLHPLALNGGALLIPKNSPIEQQGAEAEVFVFHARKAQSMLGFQTIVLYTHLPCRAARGANLSILDILHLLIRAKTRIKNEIPGLDVACFCHVDKGRDGKRTYFVSRDQWLAWNAESTLGMTPSALTS